MCSMIIIHDITMIMHVMSFMPQAKEANDKLGWGVLTFDAKV